MQKPLISVAYIDNTNLYKGCEAEGFRIDYRKFRTYLRERLGVKTAYIFIGFLPGNEAMYKQFQESGYTLVFKPTIPGEGGKIKGNCDAELVLECVSNVYEGLCENAIIVASDGDYACLVNFLKKKEISVQVLSPRAEEKCSSLLKNTAVPLTFLPEVRSLISYGG